jgi:glutamine amidotransferase
MTQNIVVIDYGSGNIASAARALALAARLTVLAAQVHVSADPALVAQADRIVLPGQGAFAQCARGLAIAPGLREALLRRVDEGVPFLGICVGMQLMAERGLEHSLEATGGTRGLGWIKGDIVAMRPAPQGQRELRLPQMGWNELTITRPHPLLQGIEPNDHVYFVHSYALAGFDPADVIAETEYGGPVVAMVARGNCAGTQFHVEKSQFVGLRILSNFLTWTP